MHQLLALAIALSSSNVPRPDLSTEADSVILEASVLTVSNGAENTALPTYRPVNVDDPTVIQIAAQRYPAAAPTVTVPMSNVDTGYYTVSVFGYPTTSMWRGDDFIDIRCAFAGDVYRMVTGVWGTDDTETNGFNAPGSYQELARFYFIANSVGPYTVQVSVHFTPEPIYITHLEVRHIDRHLQTEPVKKKSTLVNTAQLSRFEANRAQYGISFPGEQTRDGLLEIPDDVLWGHIPDWKVMRVPESQAFDCPVHGTAIRTYSSSAPWISADMNATGRYPHFTGRAGITCPLGGEMYPSNDYHAGDLTTGPYADDGMGYYDINHTAAGKDFYSDAKESMHTPHYFFLGIWAASALAHMAEVAYNAAVSYRQTGNTAYAHKAAVLLARAAYLYPTLDGYWQSSWSNMWIRWDSMHGRPGRIRDAFRDAAALKNLLYAYDYLYDFIQQDDALATLVSRHLPWAETPADVLLLIDRNILQLGYETAHQQLPPTLEGTNTLWALLGMVGENRLWFEHSLQGYTLGATSAPLIYGATNLLNRDGNGMETLLTYDIHNGIVPLTTVADSIMRWNDANISADYDVWHGEPFAKWRALLTTWPQYLVAGDGLPNLGDGVRTPLGVRQHAYPVWNQLEPTYALAYANLGGSALAYYAGGAGARKFLPFASTEVMDGLAADARQYTVSAQRTRDVTGHGLAILESRPEANLTRRAGLACRYGAHGYEHQHDDVLNVEYFAKAIDFTPDDGWPPATGATENHNTVMVDDRGSIPGGGYVNALHDGDGVQFSEVTGVPLVDGVTVDLFRRSLAMVDVGDNDTYLLDLFRIRGGTKSHAYFWHAAQAKQRVAVNVETDDSAPAVNADRFIRYERGTLPVEQVFEATWQLDVDAWKNYSRDPTIKSYLSGRQLFLREQVLPGANREISLAANPQLDYPEYWTVAVIEQASGELVKESTFLAAIEPYESSPFIQQFTDLFPDARGIELPRGARVRSLVPESAVLQVDTHLFADPAGNAAEPDGIDMHLDGGSYARCFELNASFQGCTLVGDSALVAGSETATLRTAQLEVVLNPASYRATVVEVDWRTGSVVVDAELPSSVAGSSVTMQTPAGRATNYKVTEVLPHTEGVELVLEHLYPMFVGDVATIDATNGLIQTGQQPRFGLNESVVRHFARGTYLDGTYLVNESRTTQASLKHYGPVQGKSGSWFQLAEPPDVAIFEDVAGRHYGPLGEKEHLVFVYDVGVGDTVLFVPAVSARLQGDGSVSVRGRGRGRVGTNSLNLTEFDLEWQDTDSVIPVEAALPEPASVVVPAPAAEDNATQVVIVSPEPSQEPSASGDIDDDGVADDQDNCPSVANRLQIDVDSDGFGNSCDNCRVLANDQGDVDADGIGDTCDLDNDNDGVPDAHDNCPSVASLTQDDSDGDGCDDSSDDADAPMTADEAVAPPPDVDDAVVEAPDTDPGAAPPTNDAPAPSDSTVDAGGAANPEAAAPATGKMEGAGCAAARSQVGLALGMLALLWKGRRQQRTLAGVYTKYDIAPDSVHSARV